MSALLDLLIGPLGAFLAGALGIAAAWFFGRKSGKTAEQNKQLQERIRSREVADEIDEAVAGRPISETRERLKNR